MKETNKYGKDRQLIFKSEEYTKDELIEKHRQSIAVGRLVALTIFGVVFTICVTVVLCEVF